MSTLDSHQIDSLAHQYDIEIALIVHRCVQDPRDDERVGQKETDTPLPMLDAVQIGG
jgi:hypothetical protein